MGVGLFAVEYAILLLPPSIFSLQLPTNYKYFLKVLVGVDLKGNQRFQKFSDITDPKNLIIFFSFWWEQILKEINDFQTSMISNIPSD